MARGQSSGGKRDKSAPDWLNPVAQEPSGGQTVREEKPRKRRGDDDELDEPKGKKGIKVHLPDEVCDQPAGGVRDRRAGAVRGAGALGRTTTTVPSAFLTPAPRQRAARLPAYFCEPPTRNRRISLVINEAGSLERSSSFW